MMWIYDVETLKFLAVNDRAVEAYGWTRDEFLEMSLADIRPPGGGPRADRERPPVNRGAAVFRAVGTPAQGREDRPRRGLLQRDRLGWSEGAPGAGLDVTERVQAGGAAAAGAEDGGGRPAGGRRRPRLQQPADGDLRATAPAAVRGGAEPTAGRVADLERDPDGQRRAATLTRQLLTFSRRQVLQPKAPGPRTRRSVARCAMIRRLIGEDVELRTRSRRRRPQVLADPGQLEQVLMNLVVNARDAMPDGGSAHDRDGERGAATG